MENLIIGGDGLIGSKLRELVPHSTTTSRRPFANRFLDLEKYEDAQFLFRGPKVVYLVAAETKGFDCQRDQKRTHRINVDAPIFLGHYFVGAFIVFLSSEAVMYAGDMAYGRQKALAEMGLIAACGYERVALIRPSRITSENVEEACKKIIAIAEARKFGVSEI